jgi:hypothetical protein
MAYPGDVGVQNYLPVYVTVMHPQVSGSLFVGANNCLAEKEISVIEQDG